MMHANGGFTLNLVKGFVKVFAVSTKLFDHLDSERGRMSILLLL